jgi:hypothetical protein
MAQSFYEITLNNGTSPLTLTNNPAGIHDFVNNITTKSIHFIRLHSGK